jgi:hypothetical protein
VDAEPNYRLPMPKKPERVAWEVKPSPLPSKEGLIDPQSEKTASEELTGQGPAEPLEKLPLVETEDIEEDRITGECMATSAEDRWSARVLTGDARPRTREEHAAFHEAAFEPGDTFDFSNPEDVAEYERLYRRPSRSSRPPAGMRVTGTRGLP